MDFLKPKFSDVLKESFGTAERYKLAKKYYLENIDPNVEYVAGERIYCNLCRSEKSLDMPERNVYIKAHCDCEKQRLINEERQKERRELAQKYRAWNEQYLPAEVRGASFYGIVDGTSSDSYINVCERCEKFCRNFQAVKQSGRGIWLYGEFDTGKTYLAVAILKALQNEGVLCTFTTMERILEELKETYNNSTATATEQSIMGRYSTVECLILDDFTGVKASSRKGVENWASERFCEIVKRRHNRHLPTVITSRKTIRDLTTDGLLPMEIVDKLVNKMVLLQLTEKQRRARQEKIEF